MFEKMLVLFFFMFLGYVSYKRKWLEASASKTISFLVLNFASPALVISGTVNRTGDIPAAELLQTVIIAICLYVGLFVAAILLPILLRVPGQNKGIYRLMTIFSNVGFMGLPVVQAMLGDGALLHAALFQIPYNLLIYTYGIYVLTKKQDGEGKSKVPWKSMINVGLVSCIVAILLYAFRIETPAFINEIVAGLGALTAPLSMIAIGIALAKIPFRELFLDIRLNIFTVIKLLVLPILGMLLLKQFTDNTILLGVSLVMMATPVGSMTTMLAEQYDGDVVLTSKGVALTTLLSVLTIPLVAQWML